MDGKPWDFDRPEQREKARALIREQKPLLLIGSPMCTAFCQWQNINNKYRTKEQIKEMMFKARLHLRFTMELYRMQIEEGRYMLPEHPAYVSSWDEDSTRSIMRMKGVNTILAHQCQLGMKDPRTGNRIKKPTKYMSNACKILDKLAMICKGIGGYCTSGKPHQMCSSKVAKSAAVYPMQLCKAILQGLKDQLQQDGVKDKFENGISGVWEKGGGGRGPRHAGDYDR